MHASVEEIRRIQTELGLHGEESVRNLLRLKDSLAKVDWAVLVGAGASCASGLPSWDRLTRDLAEQFGVDVPANPAENAYPGILEECFNNADSPQVFWSEVTSRVCTGEPDELHELIVALPFEAFLTLNFDCLLRKVHDKLTTVQEPRVVAYPDLKAVHASGRRLLHLHGICSSGESAPAALDSNSAVLLHSTYELAYGTSELPKVIDSAVAAYPLLLVGTSLRDWQLHMLLTDVRDRRRRMAKELGRGAQRENVTGYALVASEGEESEQAEKFTYPGRAAGIEPIFYLNREGENHLGLVKTMRWLSFATVTGADSYEAGDG